jgi:hypothetical protein
MASRNASRSCGRMRYSTVTRTGPRSSSIACAVTGAGQCIDGVRSTPAPVCSFHRQVSGMAATAPAAARKCAAGSPTQRGNLAPDRAAERQAAEEHRRVQRKPAPAHPIRQRNLRRNGERRQAAIHDAPATTLATAPSPARGETVEHHRQRLAERPQRHQPIRPELWLQPRQEKRAAHGADADDAEQHAVKPGPPAIC